MIDLTEPCPDCIHPRSDHTAPDNFAQHCLVCGCNRNSNRNWDGPEAVAGEDETAVLRNELQFTQLAAAALEGTLGQLHHDYIVERARAEEAEAKVSRQAEKLRERAALLDEIYDEVLENESETWTFVVHALVSIARCEHEFPPPPYDGQCGNCGVTPERLAELRALAPVSGEPK